MVQYKYNCVFSCNLRNLLSLNNLAHVTLCYKCFVPFNLLLCIAGQFERTTAHTLHQATALASLALLTYPNKRRRKPADPVSHLSKPPITWRHCQHGDDVTRFETQLFWVHGHVIPQRLRKSLWYIHLSRNRKRKRGFTFTKNNLRFVNIELQKSKADIVGGLGTCVLFSHSWFNRNNLR